MKRLAIIFFAVLSVVAAISCNKEAGSGALRFKVRGLDGAVADVVAKSQGQRELPAEWVPAEGDCILEIYDARGTLKWEGPVSGWSEETVLPAGDYMARVYYGAVEDEGCDKPCFGGEQAFTVVSDETTDVTVNVALANCIVDVAFGENFKNYFPVYDFTVTSGAGNSFRFDADDAEEVFIDPWKLTLSGTMVNQGGAESVFDAKEYTGLQPKTFYTINVDVANVGGIRTLQIILNDTVTAVDLGEIELN